MLGGVMCVCVCASSRQMAEEVLRGGSEDQSQNNAFEGMETLARAIELGECAGTQGILSEAVLYSG